MDHRISKDMISSGMIPSGEKNQEDLSRTQYGTAPSPNALSDVYKKMYEKKEETLNEHHKKDADGNTIPHEGEEINEAIQFAPMLAKLGTLGTKALTKVKTIAKNPVVQNQVVGSAMNQMNQPKEKPKKTADVTAGADLFDIVKGQLLDEGLTEEEIRDIMLTLTPDEILNEISVGKMANYISAADKDVQKTAASIRKDGSVMGDDPRVKRMSNRGKGMAMAGDKIARKMTPSLMSIPRPGLTKTEEYKGSGTPEQQAAMKAQVEVSKKVNRYGGKTPSGTTAVDAKKGIEDVRKSM